ncbi:MAG: histidine kinase, partial [Desulfuromonadales bacterium]|nr:histidine kinase [Desulfuromonadales bacterium]
MSKFKIFVATLLALALAAPAMAFDVKIKGDFNNRFSYSTQMDLANGDGRISKDGEDYLSEIPLSGNFSTADTKKERGDADFFGEAKYRLSMTAADDEQKVKGVLAFEFGGDKYGQNLDFGGDAKSFLEVRKLYTDLQVPFDPASRLVLGLQPVGYNKFVWSDLAAGVKYKSNRGAFGYSLGWFRDNTDLADDESDETDVFALDLTLKPSDALKVNGFIIRRDDGDYLGPNTGSRNIEHWIGVAADGQAGNLFYGGTFVYLDGEVTIGGFDVDRKAWLANLEGTMKTDAAKFTAGWLYSTGDDDPADSDFENYDAIDIYTGQLGSVVIFDSYADDNTTVGTPYIQDKGLNTVYLAASLDVTEKTTVGANYLWINSAEDLVANDDIGSEFVVRASTKVTKGLTAGIAAGYLLGGDAWEDD